MPAILEKSAVATGLEKIILHFDPIERQDKKCPKNCTTALISHASKIILKILQASLQQYMNQELPGVQAGIEKAKESEIKLSTYAGS